MTVALGALKVDEVAEMRLRLANIAVCGQIRKGGSIASNPIALSEPRLHSFHDAGRQRLRGQTEIRAQCRGEHARCNVSNISVVPVEILLHLRPRPNIGRVEFPVAKLLGKLREDRVRL
jgi:hypothetical protein